MTTYNLNNKPVIEERFLLLLICFILGFETVQGGFLLSLRSIVTVPGKLDTAFTYLLFIGVLMMSLKAIINRLRWDSIAFVFFFMVAYLISLVFYKTNLTDPMGVGIGILIPVSCYIIAASVTDFSLLKQYLNVTALLIGISSFLLLFVFRVIEGESYSQHTGYMALPAAVISLNQLFEKFKLAHLVNLILSLLVFVFAGARGPLICFVLYSGIKFLLLGGISREKRIAITLAVLLVAGGILLFYNDILLYLSNIAASKGYSLRLLTFLGNESIFVDAQRDSLRKYALQVLLENPILGIGVFNDRMILTSMMGGSLSEALGWYPHNIFLEILLQFGIFAGGLMIIWFIWILYRTLLINKNKETKDIILIFLAFGFFPLLFSGSYLQTEAFFLFLGLSTNAIRDEKISKEIS